MSTGRNRARRRADLSQHFLRSEGLASSLVAQAAISPQDVVVEIGPGRGTLTAELAPRCRRLVGVEIDARLCRGLRVRFADDEHVSIVQGDFLRYRTPRSTPYKVVGNIPYGRTADIVRHLVGAPRPPEDAYLIVQREAAERFAGRPFALETLASLQLKPWWQIEIVRRLRRTDFDPPPSVDSVVLWLARRPRPLVEPSAADMYQAFVDRCFGRSGKTVGRCLRSALTRHQIQRLSRDLHFEPSAPPSGLSFDQWLGLFRFVSAGGIGAARMSDRTHS